MISSVKLALGLATVFAGLALTGCDADTAISSVNGPACPPGPMAPLGDACTSAGQRCAYGYNPPECGGRTVMCKNGSFIEESHSDPRASCRDGGTLPGADGGIDERDVADTEDSGDADNNMKCCARDTSLGGCMYLGGAYRNEVGCVRTCDFWCSVNWRVETDSEGCEVWRYDLRRPAPGENMQCVTPPNAGSM